MKAKEKDQGKSMPIDKDLLSIRCRTPIIFLLLFVLIILLFAKPVFAKSNKVGKDIDRIYELGEETATLMLTSLTPGSPINLPFEPIPTSINPPSTQTPGIIETVILASQTLSEIPEAPSATPVITNILPTSTLLSTSEPTSVTTPTLSESTIPATFTPTSTLPTTTETPKPAPKTINGQASAQYYVSPSGLDTNPGTQDQPWKTIQKAADTMVAGDTVFVAAGDYPEQRVEISKSGSAGNPITYQAEGKVTQHGGFRINSADYIGIKGFDITDTLNGSSPIAEDGAGIFVVGKYCDLENNYIHLTVWDGIYLQGTTPNPTLSSNCIVRNNRLYEDENAGIEVHGQNHLVEGNEIWGTVQYSPKLLNPPDYVDADGIRFFGSGHIFRKNYIHDILYGPPGINPAINDYNNDPHIDCFQTFNTDIQHEVASNILFEQNICIDLDANTKLGIGGKAFQQENSSKNFIIRNNLIEAHGIAQFTDATNISIINNTFIGSSNFNGADGIYLTRVANAVIENNIFAYQENGTGSIRPDSSTSRTLTVGYNCVYRAGGKPWRAADPHDVWNVNPMFVNEASADFHLQSDSPCIDAGRTITSVTNDLDGNIRPKGNGYDIGAYESPYTATATPTPTSTPTITPLPPPNLVAPSNNGSALTTRPTFKWNPVTSATGYSFQLSYSATFSPIAVSINLVATNYAVTSDLLRSKTYFWRVMAKGKKSSAWSQIFKFMSANPPAIPGLAVPKNGALLINYQPEMDWHAVINANQYQIQIANNNSFSDSSLIVDTLVSASTQLDITTTLPPDNNYYWHVRAYDEKGQYSLWSSYFYFKTAMLPPILGYPGNNGNALTTRPTFDWGDVSGATGYTLQISKSPTFISKILTIRLVNSTYTSTSDFPRKTLLYWRVYANGIRPSTWSQVFSFNSADPPQIPVLLNPANKALVISNQSTGTQTPSYTSKQQWAIVAGADHYQLQVNTNKTFLPEDMVADVTTPDSSASITNGLIPNTTFYWRVRSFDTAGEYSLWTAVRYFRTAMSPPLPVTPPDNSTALAKRPTFTWGSVVGATGYNLQVSTNSNFSILTLNASTIRPTYTITKDLAYNQTFYWRVDARGVNPSAWSMVFAFTSAGPRTN
ncbi:MAG: choice-of-anchor Q domain-containing protein [Anaerolineaceae bacterium]|nr:choice-of-anchor Q domain-containing protein [Anaerolineaceae bacterium]